MRFRVKQSSGAESEIILEGGATLGRERGCTLVVDDSRCSRKHAVLDADGVTIRDSNSANGIFVNSRKVPSATLKAGDVLRLGDTELTVLPEEDEASGTLQMGSGTIAMIASEVTPQMQAAALPTAQHAVIPPAAPPAPPAPAPPPPAPAPVAAAAPPPAAAPVPAPPPPAPIAAPPPAPVPVPAAPAAPPVSAAPAVVVAAPLRKGPLGQPLTVMLLALLWGASLFLYGIGGVAAGMKGVRIGLIGGPILAIISGAMAYGLFARARWARSAQIALAGMGLFTPFVLPSAVVLAYMLRDEVAIAFDHRDYAELSAEQIDILGESREPLFAAGLGLALLVTVVGIAVVTALLWTN